MSRTTYAVPGTVAPILGTTTHNVAPPLPPMYAVILLNDAFTPSDFVVEILQHLFHKKADEAVVIMLKVHNEGKGVANVYPKDVAETKTVQVRTYARRQGYPLQCTMEVA